MEVGGAGALGADHARSLGHLWRAGASEQRASGWCEHAAKDVAVLGPADVGLLDFTRAHQLTLDATVALLGGVGLKPKLRSVKTATLSLDRPMKWYIEDKIELFSRLAGDPDWPRSAQGRTLARRRHYLVSEVVRARIRYSFEGSGGMTLDAAAAGLSNLRSFGLDARYRWEGRYELASKEELVVAYEAVQWRERRGTFRTLRP